MGSDSRSGTPPPATTKTRTLTASQRERKRAADRKAHRQSRERTKNYIAHLEQLLDEAATADTVADTDTYGTSTEISTFLRRLKHDFNKIDQLKKSLATICEVAQTALEDASARTSTNNNTGSTIAPLASAGATSGSDPNDEATNGTARQIHREGIGKPPIELVSDELSDTFSSPALFPQFSGGVNLTSADLTLLDMPFDTPSSDAAAGGWERNIHMAFDNYHYSRRTIWTLLGQFTSSALLSQAVATPLTTMTPDLAQDTDILIRAVLHGWDVTAGDHRLDMKWQTLKQTDQQLLAASHERPAERLAILYVMRLQLHHMLTGEYLPGTPNFLRARPSQKFINHPPHAAYYVWPGFREHLLVWPDRYSSDNLLDHLRSNFQFIWPYEPQGLYTMLDCADRFLYPVPRATERIPVFNGSPSVIFPPCTANFALSLLTPTTGAMPELCSSEDAAASQSDSHAVAWQLSPDAPAAMFRM